MMDQQQKQAAELIGAAKQIVAFTGAGISTESGLSDFRSAGGLWDRYRIVTYQEFVASHEARIEYWSMRRELIPEILAARPNAAHRALAELQQKGKLRSIITQNIDGLHQRAGNDDVIELHGTNLTASCLDCRKSWSIEEIQLRLETGDLDPACDRCSGAIKPDTISFGQSMPQKEMNRADDLVRGCDLLLMIGSSLEVQPAASLPLTAGQGGAKLIFINRTETPYDDKAHLIFREGCGEVMLGIMAAWAATDSSSGQPM